MAHERSRFLSKLLSKLEREQTIFGSNSVNHRAMVPSPRISGVKFLLLLLFCIGFRALAQFSAATVAGVVRDSSKAAITDAKLKLINAQTGAENDSTTNSEGGFLFTRHYPGGLHPADRVRRLCHHTGEWAHSEHRRYQEPADSYEGRSGY